MNTNNQPSTQTIGEDVRNRALESAAPNGAPCHPTTYQDRVELVAAAAASQPQIHCPLEHRFTPGLYIREIRMPKGAVIVSRKHLTEHPFIVSQGHAAVLTDEGVQQIRAPYCGITKPGTQRILYIHEDCVWTTFHPTNETDPEKIVAAVTETPPFLPGEKPPALWDAETVKQLTTLS
jgi:hypothetical protein